MKNYILYHAIAFFAGFILDIIFGDPHFMPHPVRLIGKYISYLESRLLIDNDRRRNLRNGKIMVLCVCVTTVIITFSMLATSYFISIILGVVVESVMTYYILSTKCLKVESMKVYDRIINNDIDGARLAVSMIVGRDTNNLDADAITRATVETVAENSSDGVIAPMLYVTFGGPVLGFLYKACNTMDSMVGYKNEKYIDYGRAAAKLDDFLNFIPARISGRLIILSALFMGKEADATNARKIYYRDRQRHSSPNSAHTEAACAGALGIRLAGPASYFGRICEKEYIGDSLREISAKDIKNANKILYIMAFVCFIICEVLLLAMAFV